MDKELQVWAQENILWAGTTKTNKSSREGHVPLVIVDHIVEGSREACIDWFNNEINKDSSAHFLVAKDGKVYQFMSIDYKAWSNGLKPEDIPHATAEIVKQQNINPNFYTVSIEHEGLYSETKGKITAQQLASTKILHKFIIQYVKDAFDHDIVPSRDTIIGHYEINPIRRPNCPGEEYPFNEIIAFLRGVPTEKTFTDIDGHWAQDNITQAYNLGLVKGRGNNIFDPNSPVTRAEAATMLLSLYNKFLYNELK
jgi:N-acetyl-anhydromuramyl-L-alanine amidase AmpD